MSEPVGRVSDSSARLGPGDRRHRRCERGHRAGHVVPRARARGRAGTASRPAGARAAGPRPTPYAGCAPRCGTCEIDLAAPPPDAPRRLPAPPPALPPARPAARARTSTASSACSPTSCGPAPARARSTTSRQTRLAAARRRSASQVFGVDKFPRMTDYVVPTGVRIADADRVRLGAHLAEGTTVMHEGFVNYNAGTLGTSMVEGRITRRASSSGDGSDVGGGASIMGTLSGGGTQVDLDRRALPDRRQRRHRHLARRRLRRRGGLLRHRRHQGDAARRARGQGARPVRRRQPAVPPQLGHRHGRGRAVAGRRGRAQRRRCTRTEDAPMRPGQARRRGRRPPRPGGRRRGVRRRPGTGPATTRRSASAPTEVGGHDGDPHRRAGAQRDA